LSRTRVRGYNARMDIRTIQPSINALNAEIARLTSARDTLVTLINGDKKPTVKVSSTSQARSEAQRKRWAEAKRKSREAKKGTK
jgi:prefoldin subunit 5